MFLAFIVAYLIGIAILMVVVCVVGVKTDGSRGSSRSSVNRGGGDLR
jgi:hypothetical protein